MKQDCEAIGPLLSAYADDELGPEERTRVEAHVDGCGGCRGELEEIRSLVVAASGLHVAPPPEEVWDTFLDNVYNRIERRTGWTVFLLGLIGLIGFGAYHFVADPWATALQKTLVATPLVGLGIVFVSVWRQRLFVAKTDRYSRDIRR